MIKKLKIFLFIIFFLSYSNAIASQIEKIEVKGNIRISDNTIKMFSKLSLGDNIEDINLNNVLKNLYNTYYFKDVSIEIRENSVIIEVEESPIIESIELKGIKAKKIHKEIKDNLKLRSRTSYNDFLLAKDKKIIENILKDFGYYFSKVDTFITELNENKISITHEIDLEINQNKKFHL